MNAQIAQIALAFLDRVDLKGAEAETYMAVKYALQNSARVNPESAETTESGYPVAPEEAGDIYQ